MKQITSTYWKSSQAIHYEGIFNYGNEKIRIDIKRDSYDNQSYSRAMIYHPERKDWTMLVKIPYPQMKLVKDQISYVNGIDAPGVLGAFSADRAALIQKVKQVI